MKKENIGLVLSGGGVKAIAHIGLIEVLLKNNIVPNIISGTSAGAMIGALYAANHSPLEMISFFEKTPLIKVSYFARNKPGFLDSEKYAKHFSHYFSENSFESLKYPLSIAATNILKAQVAYFNQGPLIKAIIASSALPPLFSPVDINGQLYCDGGILDNFPLDPIKKYCNKIIGSFVNPVTEINRSEINSSTDLVYRAYHIGMDVTDIKKFKYCNYVFSPPKIDTIGAIDTKSIRKAYQIGYDFATEEIETIIKYLKY
ncbi:patatin-like phospholipase family protein [Lutibacter citreus]|uniref:patatin-like phospholipase family protein n=1 Tax=Lutibacter citreus TaxID=2138210 RepID=UPI000DBE78B5|nr:patatin-like phospholipase family protein [Lutibacter citreus]